MEKLNYLDRLAEYGVPSAHPGGMALTKRLLDRETITAGMTVLDLGCGTGRASIYLGRHYPCKIIAVDNNPRMIERAGRMFAEYGLEIPLFRADAMELPFPNSSFDLVLVESVTVFTEIERSLREYRRILKPEGVLLEVEVTMFSPLTGKEADDLQSVLGFSWAPVLEEWLRLFAKAGFAGVQVLGHRKFNPNGSLLLGLHPAFQDYRRLMFLLRKKLGYGVYRCTLK
ncbi:MAG: class I SAM-dependent methyltransferase [Firmicutes bacterium]|nr:class I SAM-dependent methyltransferase [Bacillota bacterium]